MDSIRNPFRGDLNERWRIVEAGDRGGDGQLPAFSARARREGTLFLRVRDIRGRNGGQDRPRSYVLKALPVAGTDAAERERLERMVRTRNRFRQDNVLPIVDWFYAGPEGGYFCTVSEEMAGDLAALVLERGERLALAERCRIAARLGEQMALAMMALHRPTDGKPPVFLGALAPRDILLSADPATEPLFVAYLHDLGPGEPAPVGEAAATPADDVYALGALLHEVVAGQKPRAGAAALPVAPGYAWLADLTRAMLAADPALRPTARQALAAFLQQPPVAPRLPKAAGPNRAPAPGTDEPQGESWQAIPPGSLALSAAVLLAGLLLWLVLGRRKRYFAIAAQAPRIYRQATFASSRAGMRR